jgi:8-oxo-dGTP pyrophosphatase MutT (NUDIX family)
MLTIKELAFEIDKALKSDLPGTDAQWEMASSDRMVQNYPRVANSSSRSGGVMILLYPEEGVIKTVFIQRPVYNGVHSGQIAFPGGKMEESDIDITDTALREACEETGICGEKVSVLGILTPLYIQVSNIEVTPVVAFCEQRPEFLLQRDEVVSIIEAELDYFMDSDNISEKPMKFKNETLNVRYFDYHGNVIWGATAMILNELVEVIKRGGITL